MALCAISRIADSICEEPVATVSTLEATAPAEVTTASACVAAVRAFCAMASAAAFSWVEAPASRPAESLTRPRTLPSASRVLSRDAAMTPSSAPPPTAPARTVRSPSATWASTSRIRCTGRRTLRATNRPTTSERTTATAIAISVRARADS